MKLFSTLLLIGASLCCAVETDTLEDLSVTASADTGAELSHSAGFRYIPLENQVGSETISEILTSVPGVSVRHGGSAGSFETVSIRGVDGSRVTVCIDGVPVQSAMGGAADLSKYPVGSLQGIELYRGTVPAKLGGNSLGGAINLITKKKGEDSKRLLISAGSFSEYRGSSSIVQPIQKGSIRSYLEYHSAKNDFPYLDRNATPYNPDDDRSAVLKNNELTEFFGSSGWVYETSAGDLLVSGEFRRKTLGVPASEGFENHTAKSEEIEPHLGASLDQKFKWGTISHSISAGANKNRVSWTALDNFGSVHGVLKDDQYGEVNSKTVTGDGRSSFSVIPAKSMRLTGTVSLRGEQMIPSTSVGSFGYGEWESSRITGTAASDIELLLNACTITAGGSASVHRSHTEGGEDPYTGDVLKNQTINEIDPAGKAGISYSPGEQRFSIFTNGGLYERVPSLRERFGYHGGVLPSPDLLPENGRNGEIGTSLKLKKFSGELLFFANHIENMITTLFDGRVTRTVNFGENRSMGFEQSLFWEIGSKLNISQSATVQKTENLTPNYVGNLLPNQSPVTVFGSCAVGPFIGFTITPEFRYQARLYRDPANRQPFPGSKDQPGVLNLSVSAKWSKKWCTVYGSVKNILENRSGSDYPQENGYYRTLYPGRSWNLEFRGDF